MKNKRWVSICVGLSVLIISLGLINNNSGEGYVEPLSTPDAPREEFISDRIQFHERLQSGLLNIDDLASIGSYFNQSSEYLDNVNSTPANWSKIVFQAIIDNNYEIVIRDGGNNNEVRLTTDGLNDIHPRLNKLAADIVFASDRDGDFEIFRMQTDGSNLVKLTNNTLNDYKPDWSPDGSKIVYRTFDGSRSIIKLMNSDGTGVITLANEANINYYDPVWSPDGQKIAYIRVDGDHADEIYTMDPDGMNKLLICNGENPNLSYQLYYINSLVWGPGIATESNPITFDFLPYGEYFQRLGIYKPSIGYCGDTGYDPSTSYIDVLNSGFSPDGLERLMTEITWTCGETSCNVTGIYAKSSCLAGTGHCDRNTIGRTNALYPDWESSDIWSPVSKIDPLPAYSRGFWPVGWSGYDIGTAGLSFWQYRYRWDEGEWSEPLSVSPTISHATNTYSTYGPSLITYQVGACDDASQCESWSSDPNHQTQTRKYTWRMSGNVNDNRGFPDLTANVSIDPAPLFIEDSTNLGHYVNWMNTSGDHTISISSLGYASPPARTVNLNTDLSQNEFLSPSINFIVNGGAESGDLSSWLSGGALPVSASIKETVSGSYGFVLGNDCGGICFGVSEPLAFLNNYPGDIVMAPGKVFHVLNPVYEGATKHIYYLFRSAEGVWSEPEFVTDTNSSAGARLIRSIDGRLIVAILTSPEVMIFSKEIGGDWHLVTSLSGYSIRALKLDHSGYLHLIGVVDAGSYDDLFALSLSPEGAFSDPVRLFHSYNNIYGSSMDLQEDRFGRLHLVYAIYDKHYHQIRNVDGLWGSAEQLPGTGIGSLIKIIPGSDRLHMFVYGNYQYQPYADTATPKISLYNQSSNIYLADREDVIYNFNFTTNSVFKKKYPGKPWSADEQMPETPKYLFIDEDNRFHMFFAPLSPLQYASSLINDTDETATISQTVTIPADMNKPTLSFMDQISGGDGTHGTGLIVNIIDGETTATVFTDINRTHLWEHQWVDLTDFLGKTVDVQFKIDQKSGDPVIHIDLDDISIGAWLTPLLYSVSPNQCVIPDSSVTISGENFLPGVRLFLNEGEVDPSWITWQDAQTLLWSLPVDFPLGVYTLQLMNPGNQLSPFEYTFYVGCPYFLPEVLR
jgi:hypothetical protein